MKVTVKIVPYAKTTELVGEFAGVWRIRVAAPPKENKANGKLVAWLAKKLGLAKSLVTIKKGHTSSIKIIRIEGEWSKEDFTNMLK